MYYWLVWLKTKCKKPSQIVLIDTIHFHIKRNIEVELLSVTKYTSSSIRYFVTDWWAECLQVTLRSKRIDLLLLSIKMHLVAYIIFNYRKQFYMCTFYFQWRAYYHVYFRFVFFEKRWSSITEVEFKWAIQTYVTRVNAHSYGYYTITHYMFVCF